MTELEDLKLLTSRNEDDFSVKLHSAFSYFAVFFRCSVKFLITTIKAREMLAKILENILPFPRDDQLCFAIIFV